VNVRTRLTRGAGAYAQLMEAVEAGGWEALPRAVDGLYLGEAKDLAYLLVRARHLNVAARNGSK
jgi:hypothetical protein